LHLVYAASLSDPPTTSIVGAAVNWIESVLLGSVGMTIAVIAVASIGFLMLAGRVPLRHGLTVVAGCFLLFGSPAIVAGLRSTVEGSTEGAGSLAQAPIAPSPLENVTATADPYAGASVPVR